MLLIVFLSACNSEEANSNEELYRSKELVQLLQEQSVDLNVDFNVLIVPTVFCASCVNKVNQRLDGHKFVIVTTNELVDSTFFDSDNYQVINIPIRQLERKGLSFPSPRYFEVRNGTVTVSESL